MSKLHSIWKKVLTCVGNSKGEHLSAVFELLSELPDDIALSISGEPVDSLGRIQNAHLTEGVGGIHVSVDGEGHHGPGGMIERRSGGLRSGDLNDT